MRQIAVLKETAGKGSFCSLVMAVVVAKDILVFCCFAINLEVATTAMRLAEGGSALAHLVQPLMNLLMSLLLGLAGGAWLGWALQPRGSVALRSRVTPRLAVRLRVLAVVTASSTLFFGARVLHAEPLLACVVAGLITANRRREIANCNTLHFISLLGRHQSIVARHRKGIRGCAKLA